MDKDRLLDVADTMPIGIINEVPGVTTALNFDGSLKGFISTTMPGPYVNLVGESRLDETNAAAVIDEVFATFGNTPFGWMVGPKSTPLDLRDRLLNKGLKKHHSSYGMVLDDFDIPIAVNQDIEVRPINLETALSHSDEIAEAYGMGMTGDSARHIFQSTGRNNSTFWTQVYIVYEKGGVSPIGFCVAQYLRETPIVILGGSSTFPQWRGKNVYKTMVAKRLRNAKRHGAEVAMIQAVSDTSAPICRKLGFVEFCDFDFYVTKLETRA